VYINLRGDGRLILGGLRSIDVDKNNNNNTTNNNNTDAVATDAGEGDPVIAQALQDWLQTRFPRVRQSVTFDSCWKGALLLFFVVLCCSLLFFFFFSFLKSGQFC
jgi:hypothetical protein